MPAPPEIGDGIGGVRIVEVLLIVEAAHKTHADRHIGVGREVQIDLEHEGDRADPDAEDGGPGEVFGVEQEIGHCGAAVGQDRLLGEADGKAGDAPADLGHLDAAVENVVLDVTVADDGTGDALVEQTGIEQQQPVFRLGVRIAAVDVHHVGHELEGIEADADGQDDIRDHLGYAGDDLKVAQEEAGIFENAEDHKLEHDAGNQIALAAAPARALSALDAEGKEPADEGHAEQQRNVTDAAPGVEHQGEAEHDDILLFQVRYKGLGEKICKQENEDEKQAGENQINASLPRKTAEASSGQLIDAKFHNSFPLYRKNRQFARGKGGNPVDGAWG